jgi:tetratricopeptide (TPR) repeat protein
LFDANGRVVGVTTSLLNGAPGIYFSIGVGDVNRLLRTPYTAIMSFSTWSASNVAPIASTPPEIQDIQTLIDQKSYEPAKARLLKLLEGAPADPILHKLLGEVHLFLGDNKSALAQLKTALDENADDNDAQGLYSLALYLAGRFVQAAQVQEIVVKADPSSSNLGFLSEIYYSEEKFKDAEDTAQKALLKNPSEEAALSVLAGNVYWRRSTSQVSWADLETRLAAISKNSFWVKIQRAFDLAKQNKEQEEIALLQEAKKDLFNDAIVYRMLCGIYEKNDQIGLARDEIQQGLGMFPDDSALLNIAVAVDLLSHNDTSAYRNASHLIEVAPGSRDELYATCLYTYGTEQATLAVQNCTKLAEAYPDDHTALSNLGWAALDASQFSLASQKFGQAYKLVAEKWGTLTTTQVIDLVWGVAISEYYTGDKKDCKKLLEFLRKDYPSALTVTGLQQLPLIWSKTTMTRIEAILRDLKP